jgi:hypothetical protein
MSTQAARPLRPLAATAACLAMVVLGLQYVIARPSEDAVREFLVVTALIGISTAIVFGLVLPRLIARGGSARVALTLSLLGLITAAAYWSGVAPVLALGGLVLARHTVDPGSRGMARTASAVAVLALVADLAALIVDGILS